MTVTRRQFITTSAIAAGAVVMTPFGRAIAAPVVRPAAEIVPTLTVRGDKLGDALKTLGPYTPGGPIRKVTVIKSKTAYKCTKPIYVPSGVYLEATGATLLLNMRGTNTALLQIENAVDVTVNGGTWDGYKKLEKKKTEWRHAIRVHGSQNVRLQNLSAKNAKGDGIYIGTNTAPCTNVTVTGVKCYSNARAGLAITSCNGFTCTGSKFYSNKGEAPEAGVVIEPHPIPGQDASVIDNILFSGCRFYSNAGRGFLAVMQQSSSLTPETGITLLNCSYSNNGRSKKDSSAAGIALLRPRLVTVTGGTSSGNKYGVYVLGKRSEAQDANAPVRGSVNLNGLAVVGNLLDGVIVQSAVSSLRLQNSTIKYNSRKKKYKYDGLRIKQGSNVQVTGGAIVTKHRYGVYADKGVTGVVLTGTNLSGNKKGKVYAKGASVTVN